MPGHARMHYLRILQGTDQLRTASRVVKLLPIFLVLVGTRFPLALLKLGCC